MYLTESVSNQKLFDNLLRPLELDSIDRSIWNDKCDYLDPDKCVNLNLNNYNLVVLQQNIRSLISNRIELKQLLRNLERKNSKVDLILLGKTFLTDQNLRMVSVPGYNIISNHREMLKGGGVVILIRNDTTYKPRKDLDALIQKEFESVFLEIALKNGKKVVVGSLYRAPDMRTDNFINSL